MYVLHIDTGQSMHGGQWQVYYLVLRQAKEGFFTPVVACPAGSALEAKLQAAGIETIALSGSKQWNPVNLLKILRSHLKKKFTLVHTHDGRAASLGAFLHTLRLRQPKLLHTRRVAFPLRKRALGKYKRADLVVAVSNHTASVLKSCGLPPEKLLTIHSGIDLSRYAPKAPRADSRFAFVAVGALTPQKGHALIINAMAQLKEIIAQDPYSNWAEWEVRIIGEGPMFNELLALATKLEVADKLALLGQQDASKILPFCDCMLVPSLLSEGSNGTIKEAWAVGLPLICSDLEANLELALPEKNALFFASGNAAELAHNMARLLQDSALQKHLVAEGKLAVQNVTADRMAEAYTAVYKQLLNLPDNNPA